MIGRTLTLYFAGRFAKMVLAMFVLFFCLIATISYFELVRKVLQSDDYDVLRGATVILLRVPSILGIRPALRDPVRLDRRLRHRQPAAGSGRRPRRRRLGLAVPAAGRIVGLLFGVVATTLYNPIAVDAASTGRMAQRVESVPIRAAAFDDEHGPVWLRQAGGDRESIIGAAQSFDHGLGLTGVTAMSSTERANFSSGSMPPPPIQHRRVAA